MNACRCGHNRELHSFGANLKHCICICDEYKDPDDSSIKFALQYQYKSICPKCKLECIHYLKLLDFKTSNDTVVVANGSCKCGYQGLVDLRYVGRVLKPYKYCINPHLIDPY